MVNVYLFLPVGGRRRLIDTQGFPAHSSLPGITGFKFSSSSAVIRDEHAQSRQASLEVFKNIVKCVEFHSVLQQAIFSLHISL